MMTKGFIQLSAYLQKKRKTAPALCKHRGTYREQNGLNCADIYAFENK